PPRPLIRAAKALLHDLKERADVRRADLVVVSYPKSGRTWLRLLVGRALAEQFGVLEATEADPDLLLRTERLAALAPGIPSVVFSHDDKPHTRPTPEIETDKSRFADSRVLFLHRDPRDVAVSQYLSLTRRTENGYMGSLAAFVRDEALGPANHIAYLNVWARAMVALPSVRFLSYEALHAAPEAELASVLAFAGAEGVVREVIERAVAFGSFENMRRMETGGTFRSGMLRPADPSDPASFKTRSGTVGGYTEHLAAADIAHLDALLADRLDPVYGYG
ncbi:MAG: sulfotransferase domain-containing protein, partial [Bacteroidota bacterium]